MTDPREQRLDPEKWPLDEVLIINSHAMLMGYLTMAIKGLGYLVLTWTTVVLLGGFVSMLHKKDFWCLTFITLVQTAGVFDAVMNEKLSYIGNAVIALLRDGYLDVLSERDPSGDTYSWLACLARFLLACILTFVQVLVLVVVLCPLAILYVLGIVMSGGISLWRLIQHDYSNSDTNGEAANLAPALDTLYYLALLQGVLFCYRFILRRMRNRLANEVASKKYKSDCSDVEVVSNYLCETRRGCEKDQSFAKGRNLITVAVDKIGSNSLFECISGVRMLYTSINIVEKKLGCLILESANCCLDSVSGQHIPMKQQDILRAQHKLKNQRNIVSGQRLLTNYLIVSASPSRHVLQKLLEMLDPRGVYNREIRNKAASILELLAFNINLEEFPRGIQHISSLIGTLQDYGIAQPYERAYDNYGWLAPSLAYCDDVIGEFEKAYKLPLLSGLLILERLACDENNCRIMCDTQDLISKIMAPVTSDLLHCTTDDHHGLWSEVVYRSMKVLAKLTRAPGETGAKLRREISSYEEAINTLWRILSCDKCNEEKQQIAFIILGRLYYMDTESSRPSYFIVPKKESSSDSKEVFIWKLVSIFTRHDMYSSSTRVYAGGVLSWICLGSGISDVATIVRHTSGGDVVDGLTKVLTQDQDDGCRQVAAEILENLCAHYIEDDEFPGKLKKVVTGLIPEVMNPCQI